MRTARAQSATLSRASRVWRRAYSAPPDDVFHFFYGDIAAIIFCFSRQIRDAATFDVTRHDAASVSFLFLLMIFMFR